MPSVLAPAPTLKVKLLAFSTGNGYDYASVSYASLFLTQVYLNFFAIPPCTQKSSTYTTADIPEKLRKIDLPQVKIVCIFMMTLFKSICLLFQTSGLNLYFASSFSQFVSLQLMMSSKQVEHWRTARNRHTSSLKIAATHNKQRHICPSVEMSKCWRQQTHFFARTSLVTWIIAVWLRWRFL